MSIKQEIMKINEQIKEIQELKGTLDNYGKEQVDKCECEKDKLVTSKFCPECKREIEERFSTLLIKFFDLEEAEYLDQVIEGYYLKDFMKKGVL